MGMWREMMKSVVAEGDGSNASDNGRRGNGKGKGRLEELFRQAGAWQILKSRRRGDGPWTLHRLASLL